ncbi:SDR family oxidoreductase [Alkalibacterium putridalgicola]|uniref:SDR family oxidoreductase n=1 Tax=Alkalibacterium putridalgicola TaxID=426703 RepID=UPI0034CFC8DD
MKTLVTGASGTVGKYAANELLKMNAPVVVAGTDTQKLLKIYGKDVERVKLDFTKEETFDAALKDIDRVFLMRPPHMGKAEGLYPFIDSMKDHDIKLVSFLSLMGVEKNPFPPHHKIEKYIAELGIPFAHIRPGFFMQNLSGIHAEEIKNNNEILVPAGKSKTSFIDAADIGLAVATVLKDPEKFKNTAHTLTGPESLDYLEVAEILSQVTKKNISYADPGFLAYRRHYVNNRGFDKKYVNVTMALYLMTRLGTAEKVTDEFEKMTGKKPNNFRDFVERNIDCFM